MQETFPEVVPQSQPETGILSHLFGEKLGNVGNTVDNFHVEEVKASTIGMLRLSSFLSAGSSHSLEELSIM